MKRASDEKQPRSSTMNLNRYTRVLVFENKYLCHMAICYINYDLNCAWYTYTKHIYNKFQFDTKELFINMNLYSL